MPKLHASLKPSDVSQVFIVARNDTSSACPVAAAHGLLAHHHHPPAGPANVLQRRPGEVYVHYVNQDKRLDEWVPERALRPAEPHELEHDEPRGRKRKRAGSVPPHVFGSTAAKSKANGAGAGANGAGYSSDAPAEPDAGGHGHGHDDVDSDDSDVNEHRLLTAKRNFEHANFRDQAIKTWCVFRIACGRRGG